MKSTVVNVGASPARDLTEPAALGPADPARGKRPSLRAGPLRYPLRSASTSADARATNESACHPRRPMAYAEVGAYRPRTRDPHLG
jgi:hypothetical protein